MSKILAGDIGGTKVRLSEFDPEKNELHEIFQFVSKDYSDFSILLKEFEERCGIPRFDAACFGVPGPVVNGEVQATNLPWLLNEKDLQEKLEIPRVTLVNDLYSTAAAIPHFPKEKILNLYQGTPPVEKERRSVIVAPGTGLGQAFMRVYGEDLWICPSEGGHSDLAPTSPIEVELYQYLNKFYEHVSYERVLSGPGLINCYDFLKNSGYGQEPEELKKRFQDTDPAAVIGQAGLNNEFELCSRALDLFVALLGSHSGNLALAFNVNEAVYLGGGIPPKIIQKLKDGPLVKSFLNKGRLSKAISGTSINVILDDHAAIFGAGIIAARS